MKGTRTAVKEAFGTRKRTLSVIAITALAWTAFVLVTRPTYSFQMLSVNILSTGTVLSTLIWNQNATYGPLGVLLPATMAFLVGVLTVTTALSFFQNYRTSSSISGTLGGAIGFAGAGCASCGAGLLTLLGVSGGVALLPFNGLGVQAASIAILLGSLEYTGRQDQLCKVRPE